MREYKSICANEGNTNKKPITQTKKYIKKLTTLKVKKIEKSYKTLT